MQKDGMCQPIRVHAFFFFFKVYVINNTVLEVVFFLLLKNIYLSFEISILIRHFTKLERYHPFWMCTETQSVLGKH